MNDIKGQVDNRGRIAIDTGKIERIREYHCPEDLYRDLIDRVRKYHPSDDITLIERAYDVACKAHTGQLRKSGEPYIIHPLCVSIILAELEMDKETIAAGLLHDVVEDTVLTREQIAERFGTDVALLVEGVTKLKKLKLSGDYGDKSQVQQEMQARNLRKMFLAMAKDIRVILIKLADRLHNMRTLEFMPLEKQQRISQETVDIYAPIADRLGISKIKVELDDLSLKYLYPDIYYDLVEKVEQRKSERDHYVQEIAHEIKDHIKEAGIEGTVDGRVKHLFSIYRKMVNQNKSLEEIYDLFAVRVIVGTIRDCYAVLGTIHELYKPIPGRFKDYIAMPKANMYQSLHTTLIGPAGQPFEIQIRTYEMHRAAEYGIAAHWKYKEAGSSEKVEKTREEEKLVWLRQILEWQQDMSDNREFMDILKSDLNLFSDDVYCFTPRGEVKNLPAGSTPVDFAYAIHTAVGNRMVGARVNDKIVPINYVIKNGDRIEIITSANSKGPSLDWLSFAKAASTRNKINQWFKRENKEENIIKGRELIYAYAKAHNLHMHELIRQAYVEIVLQKYGFRDWEALLAAIGHGGIKEGQVVNKLADLYAEDHKHQLTSEEIIQQVQNENQHTRRNSAEGSVVIKGAEGLSIRFSKCCNPVPGDEIVGYITRGRGISIHRKDCSNVSNLPDEEQDRLIEAAWAEGAERRKEEGFLAEIKIYARDRSGLLNELTKVFSEKDISILRITSSTSKQGIATLTLGFEVKSRQELHEITMRLQGISDVQAIKRTSG
ncbi:MAG: bifunctional (p)ppGpp synthetase/guanosine-3',5'-bis(diphosphate) 3'-pyrophosphohydrolase [Lachnospiraceae bacterium]|nr:bifunctional (p)ppGpp synthetase/guanosine-3',5'-bis(diphosphate) 3'-pyrophosphohydrolase [Lachnospiraceae bacterium]